ncbi:MAG: ParB/RepB/Spo0J family partition protein [Xenococcaceae cyanobacterium]
MLDRPMQDFMVEKNCDGSSFKRKYANLPLTSIVLPQNQSRRYFDSQKLSELTECIRQHGILEPLIVRHLSHLNGKYELVAGERRYRAAKEAGLTEVPVSIFHLSTEEASAISLCENLQREDLNPVEETEGILRLLSLRLKMSTPDVIALLYRMRNEANNKVSQNVLTNTHGQTIKAVFNYLGKISWKSFITSRLPLLKLPKDLLKVLRQGEIAYTKAKILASVEDIELREILTKETISQNLSLSQLKKRIRLCDERASSTQTWEQKAKITMKRLVRSRLWENPTKRQQAEELLLKLEQLLSE